MFLCCTSQGVVITVKWLISLVVTSNHKCLNKVVYNKLALIIFEPGTQPQRWYMSIMINFVVICLQYMQGRQTNVNALAGLLVSLNEAPQADHTCG